MTTESSDAHAALVAALTALETETLAGIDGLLAGVPEMAAMARDRGMDELGEVWLRLGDLARELQLDLKESHDG